MRFVPALTVFLLLPSILASAQAPHADSAAGREAFARSDYNQAARLLQAALNAQDAPPTRIYLAASLAFLGRCEQVPQLLAPASAPGSLPDDLADLAASASRQCAVRASAAPANPLLRPLGRGLVHVFDVEVGAAFIEGLPLAVTGLAFALDYFFGDAIGAGFAVGGQLLSDGQSQAVAGRLGPRLSAHFHPSPSTHPFVTVEPGVFMPGPLPFGYVRFSAGADVRLGPRFALSFGLTYQIALIIVEPLHQVLVSVAPALVF